MQDPVLTIFAEIDKIDAAIKVLYPKYERAEKRKSPNFSAISREMLGLEARMRTQIERLHKVVPTTALGAYRLALWVLETAKSEVDTHDTPEKMLLRALRNFSVIYPVADAA